MSPTQKNSIELKSLELNTAVAACTVCERWLPDPPKPIFQFHPAARILIVGQAPGRITRERGKPFDDLSGERLRDWLGVTPEQFYDATLFALLPMGFCYPGKGSTGDLPPRPECAETWREPLLAELQSVELTLLIGQYAQAWHLEDTRKNTLTERVANWRDHQPHTFLLPHPSPRNNRWLRNNPWFESELVPALQQRVRALLKK